MIEPGLPCIALAHLSRRTAPPVPIVAQPRGGLTAWYVRREPVSEKIVKEFEASSVAWIHHVASYNVIVPLAASA